MRRLLVLFLLLTLTTTLSATVRRAVFEVGSNKTKMEVADVEEGRIVQVLHREFRRVPLQWDLSESPDNCFSREILAQAEKVLRAMHLVALDLGADEMRGVATAAMRNGDNGAPFLEALGDELGFPFTTISQETEGAAGLYTVAALLEQPVEELVSWDCGGGSFQLTTLVDGAARTWEGPLGSSSFTASAIEHLYGLSTLERPSPNPVTGRDIERLSKHLTSLTGTPPQWLLEAIETKQVVGLGGPNSIFGLAHRLTGHASVSAERAEAALWKHENLADHEITWLTPPNTAVPRLIILNGIMESTGIEEVEHLLFSGTTPGLVIMEHLWQTPS